MKMRDVKILETDKVINMYNETRQIYKLNSIKSFCENYIGRCGYCNKITYNKDLLVKADYYGTFYACCPECQQDIDIDKHFLEFFED